jgi:hypothetical protein
VDELHQQIIGPPIAGGFEKGLAARVMRLEDSEKRRNRVLGIALTASIGAVLKTFWATFTGSK